MTTTSYQRVRFDAFEVDLRSRELRKHGVKIKLHQQPLQILALLLEHPGEVVTREELQRQLWPSDTFVDFGVGLNSAVKKLREALRDSDQGVAAIHEPGWRRVRIERNVHSRRLGN